MFTSRDFLRIEYNVLSKNVTRDVSQSEKTHDLKSYNKIIYYTLCKFLTLSIHFIGQAAFANFH